jgi:hypothetical protein
MRFKFQELEVEKQMQPLLGHASADLTANKLVGLKEQWLAEPGTVKDVRVLISPRLDTFFVHGKKLWPFYIMVIPMEAGSLKQSTAIMCSHDVHTKLCAEETS